MTKQSKSLGVVAVLALAGVFVMLCATRFSIGVFPDSISYFDAARNLANGRGLVVISGTGEEPIPLTHYPPLYSVLLALMSSTGATVETSARCLHAILFAANIFLVGLSIRFIDPNSFWLPVTGAFLMLAAPDMLANHSLAMTEPLYLLLTFSGMLALAAYLQSQRRHFLLASGVLIALSILTRYIGVATVGTGVIALLMVHEGRDIRLAFSFRGEAARRKLHDALLFVTVSCLPIALWSIRNHLASGEVSDRQLDVHPLKLRQIVSAFSTSAQWLLVGKVRLDVRFLAFVIETIVVTGLTVYVIRKGRPTGNSNDVRTKLPQLLGIFMIVYLAIFIFIITFFEADNVLDGRSLLPVHFALLVLAPVLTRTLYRRAQGFGAIRAGIIVVTLLLAGSYAFRGARWLAQAQSGAQGFASREWQDSGSIAQIRKLPSGIPIYSNGVDAIYYLTGRRALSLPSKLVKGTGRPNANYQAELQKMSDDMRQHQGVLVYFNTLSERWFLPLESELKSQLPLSEVLTGPDGSIYEFNRNSQHGR